MAATITGKTVDPSNTGSNISFQVRRKSLPNEVTVKTNITVTPDSNGDFSVSLLPGDYELVMGKDVIPFTVGTKSSYTFSELVN